MSENITASDHPEIEKKQYRTKKMAGNTVRVPDVISLPSNPKYQPALSFSEKGKDYIVRIQQEVKIDYDSEHNRFVFNDVDMNVADLEAVRDTHLSDVDLMLLRTIYSIIGESLVEAINKDEVTKDQCLGYSVKVHVPELADTICRKGNLSKEELSAVMKKVMTFNHMIGILYEYDLGRFWATRLPMLVWFMHSEKDNTLSLCSPYMNMLVYNMLQDSIRVDRKGNIQTKRNGQPLFEPYHSYLVKSSIVKERNKRAAEIVCIVCALIEQAGDFGTAHISARTILDRHAELQQALDEMEDASHKNRLLKSTFLKAWELLHTQTKLEEVYKNIKFPSKYPTMATLDMVFEFPHKGKKKTD